MTSANVGRLTPIIVLVFLSQVVSGIAAQDYEATPDPYFKPPAKKPDFSETYVPPSFSPGSIGAKRIPKLTSKAAVPWSHQRSIVRDRSSAIVDSPDKIQLVAAQEPVAPQRLATAHPPGSSSRQDTIGPPVAIRPQQEGVRVAARPEATINASPSAPTLEQFEPSRVIALVGGEPIFVGDMLFEANQIIEAKISQAPADIKDMQRKRLLTMLTKKYVDQKLLQVDAMSKLPAEAQVDEILKQATSIFNEQILPGMMEKSKVASISELDAKLRLMGSSLRQYRSSWAVDQLARQFTQESLNINETVTHQDMLEDYLANKEKYANRARARWEQIMVRFSKYDSRKEAKKKIAEIGNQIVYGASFAEIAKKNSDGFRALQGGQHDWTGKNALVLKKVDEAIFTLPLNQLSDIIESRDGYHIIRVIEREDAGYTPFTEAQMEIQKRLKNERTNAAFEKHLNSLRTNIPVEYYSLEESPLK